MAGFPFAAFLFFFLLPFSCSSLKTDPWRRCLHCYCFYFLLLLLDASAFESKSESSGSEFCEEVCGRKGRIRAVWRRECRGKLRSSPEGQTAVTESQAAAATFEPDSLGQKWDLAVAPFRSAATSDEEIQMFLACSLALITTLTRAAKTLITAPAPPLSM